MVEVTHFILSLSLHGLKVNVRKTLYPGIQVWLSDEQQQQQQQLSLVMNGAQTNIWPDHSWDIKQLKQNIS